MWNEITYPFPNSNSVTVEVWEWISNFIPHFIGHSITYACWDYSSTMLVKGASCGTLIRLLNALSRQHRGANDYFISNNAWFVALCFVLVISWVRGVISHIFQWFFFLFNYCLSGHNKILNVPCARLHGDHFIVMWITAKWNFHWIQMLRGKSLVKRYQGNSFYLYLWALMDGSPRIMETIIFYLDAPLWK